MKHRMVLFFAAVIGAVGVVVAAGFIFRLVQITVAPQSYLTPGGPLHLLKIGGDEVVFRRADGSTGRLNYVMGTWGK